MSSATQPIYYQGSVKNLLGPFQVNRSRTVVFEYSDAFSVFDWGRMPDQLDRKGEALAVLAADFFERIEKPDTWREFSKSSVALALRKANRFGAAFNELGEVLQAEGLRTHYIGVLSELDQKARSCATASDGLVEIQPKLIQDMGKTPFRRVIAQQMAVVRPEVKTVFGRTVPDYQVTRNAAAPKLIPLEVVFRLSCPEGSSLLSRVGKDSTAQSLLGLGAGSEIVPGAKWEFPLLECFTKLESTDRLLPVSEALAISGLSVRKLEDLLFKTVWVAGLLKYWFSQQGLELADGKLEWGLAEDGNVILVDAIGPDELRILRDGVQLSKEFLRSFYRETKWYESIEQAKVQAKNAGQTEWKRWVHEVPPVLPSAYRDLASQVYLSLANAMTGKAWFPEAHGGAYGLDQVVHELKLLKGASK